MEELIDIIKMLVSKVETLERKMNESSMALIKSGMVVHTPRPSMETTSHIPDGDTIAKMDWDELNELVGKMEGTI
jgi:hypothetical protein